MGYCAPRASGYFSRRCIFRRGCDPPPGRNSSRPNTTKAGHARRRSALLAKKKRGWLP